LALGGETETLEGADWQRHVLIAFENKAQALAC